MRMYRASAPKSVTQRLTRANGGSLALATVRLHLA
jgi:hypothetical protein